MSRWIHRKFWALAATVTLAALLWLLLGGEQSPPVSIRGLFLGDQGHHQPADRFAQLEPVFRMKGIELVYTDSLDDLNPETLSAYGVLLIYANHPEISEEQQSALLNFVSSGGGFVAIHSASYCFLNSPQYVELVGAQFKSHGTGVFEAHITDPTHPITENLEAFETWDETYLHDHHNPDRHLLMVREEDGHQEAWTWVRNYGEGRVFYTAYGHDHRTWSHPQFHRLLEQGVRWSVKELESPEVLEESEPFEYVEATVPYYDQPWETAKPQTRMQLPLTAEESLKRIQVPEGFRVELFAAEPDVINPVAMAWDERGRLWIAETVDYPNEKQPPGQGNDRIKICEDTDGDGQADRFTVFAEGLSIPTSLLIANGGVVVSQPPEILFLKDSDGDDRADERQVLFSGFGVSDTHASASNLRWGFDNWIWGTLGYSGFEGTVGGDAHDFRQGIYRFRPDGSKLEFLASTSNNTWGLGFTEEGFVFASTANNQHSVYMGIPNRYYEGVYGWTPGVLPGIADHLRFHPIKDNVRQVDWHGGYTAAAGHAVYTARSYPHVYWNRVAFVNEPSGSLLHRCVLRPQGSHFVSHDARNLLASDDEWVAPIAAEVGPDGAVWMIDWYNYIVQHNPTPHGFENGPGNAYETPLRDKEHGRIYRIVHRKGEHSPPPDVSSGDAAELVRALSHDNLLWRLKAQRLLYERGETSVAPGLIELVRNPDVDELGLNVGAIHALWTLHGLGLLDGAHQEVTEVALQALRHSSAAVRLTAVRVLPRSGAVRDALSEMLGDSDAHVRLEVLLALSETERHEPVGRTIFEALKQPENLRDRWIPDAIVAAAARHSPGFLQSLSQSFPENLTEVGSSVQTRLNHVFQLVAADYARQGPADTILAVLRAVQEAPRSLQSPVLEGLAEGWPKGAAPRFTDTDVAELSLLFQNLPGEQQDHLLVLIERWGQQQALSIDVASIVERLRRQVTDSSLSPEVRSEAARRLIRLDEGETSLQLILDHTTARTPLDVARGFLKSLSESSSQRVASGLLQRWGTMSPGGREAAVQVLLRRASWIRSLLRAIEGGVIHHSDLKAEQLQQLALHNNREIAEHARRLAEASGRAYSSDRLEVIEQLLPAARVGGDGERGRLIFEENCRRCHGYQGEGGLIGPDLTGLGNRSRADILVDILDPNRSVEGNYKLWLITTREGESWAGRLESETQTTMELLTASGERHVIPRQSIERIRASQLSIMPDGFEEQITAEEMADLLEFLTSTPGPPDSTSPQRE